MKYLIQHTKELIITVGVFISVALIVAWAIHAIIRNELSYENIIALLAAIFEMLGWYYNMPTSKENCEHTGLMRLAKQQNNIRQEIGENFFDEIEEAEDFEEEEE